MRRFGVSTVLGLVAGLLSVSVAVAAPPYDGCGVGPAGPGKTTIESWELWTQGDYASELFLTGFADDLDEANRIAGFVFDKENRNGDDYLCVMKQVLPNDASGYTTWLVTHDNTAKAKT